MSAAERATPDEDELRDLVQTARSAIRGDDIVDLALELASRPSPAGDEGALAHWLAAHLAERGVADVRLSALAGGDGPSGPSGSPCEGGARSNLTIGTATPRLCFYGHLDTSLHGDVDVDGRLTGRSDPPVEPRVEGGSVWGFGIGVAKAPTAAALVTLLAVRRTLVESGREDLAASLGALVAAGGTHRATPPWPATTAASAGGGIDMGVGVRAALAAGYRPGAVLVAKGGAPGVLFEEPGSLYLAVTTRDHYGAALVRPLRSEPAGAAAALGPLLGALTQWRSQHLAARRGRGGQLAPDVVVGAVEAGLPAKPDVLSDAARVSLYVITLPEDDEASILAELRAFLDHAVPELRAEVELYGRLPGGAVDPAHPWVEGLTRSWRGSGLPGSAEPVAAWRGSTDGALLRANGVPTARLGPPLHVHPDDPRVEGVVVAELVAWAGVWADAAMRYLLSAD